MLPAHHRPWRPQKHSTQWRFDVAVLISPLSREGSFLISSLSKPWHSLQWPTIGLPRPSAAIWGTRWHHFQCQMLCIIALRITIYAGILNQWLKQVIATMLYAKMQMFHFFSHKIYSTSNTVGSESIKHPNYFLVVITVIAVVVFQAGGHRPFLLSSDPGIII